jgi:ADP-ribose pyrophosphatase YjhB (NUDIX family)
MNVNVMAFILDGAGNILAVCKSDVDYGNPVIPSGRMKLGETPVEAVLRILEEKLGYNVSLDKLRIVYHTYKDGELIMAYMVNDAVNAKKHPPSVPGCAIDWFSQNTIIAGTKNGALYKDIIYSI